MFSCRIAELGSQLYQDVGRHRDHKSDRICPPCLCQEPEWSSHSGGNCIGCAIECERCHNYVIYYDDINMKFLFKEEFYSNEYCIIKYDKEILVLDKNDRHVLTIPVFDNCDIPRLFDKIKTYVVFS